MGFLSSKSKPLRSGLNPVHLPFLCLRTFLTLCRLFFFVGGGGREILETALVTGADAGSSLFPERIFAVKLDVFCAKNYILYIHIYTSFFCLFCIAAPAHTVFALGICRMKIGAFPHYQEALSLHKTATAFA